MPNVRPPAHFGGAPHVDTIPLGTTLFRVHLKQYDGHDFNPASSHRYYGGGRFDATADDAYPFMYAGQTVDVAVAETLLRDLVPNDVGIRQLPRPKIAGRRISSIEITVDLEVVSLRSAQDLGAVAQDTWLTMSDPRDYAQSRHWGHWIRSVAPAASGYVWKSKRDPVLDSFVLFGDRTPAGAIVTSHDPSVPPGALSDFDTYRGRRELRMRVARHGVALARR
jgi:hypothetical protein